MTSSDRSKTFCCVKCVSKRSASVFFECWVKMPSHREAYCLSSHCAMSHRLLLPSFPAYQADRFSRALISGSVFTFFLCPNLANTNSTANNRHCGTACQFRCAPLHPGPSWLRLPRSPTPPLSVSLAWSFLHAELPFHEDYITAHFISHTSIHTHTV